MTNAAVASELAALRAAHAAGEVSIENVGRAFERLTYELADIRDGDGAKLASLVNEIELIRFTQLLQDALKAIQDVLTRAQALFDELAS